MKKERINQGWDFCKEGQEDNVRSIDLPHDAMLLEKRNPDIENGSATGFYPGGKYIYKKSLFGEEEYRGKKTLVEFEGVYTNPTVYLNEEEVGSWKYGYTNFYIDLTGKLKIGEENELKVLVDNSKTPNSRWYSGSGIYRPVNIWTSSSNSINPEGIKVKTITTDPAVIEVNIEADIEDGIEILCTVAKDGTIVAEGKGGNLTLIIPEAKLWDAENPNLYTLKTVLKQGEQIVDTAETRFGIRTIKWNSKQGLQINGETVKLRGGCVHHDHGPLGACAYDKAEYRRIKKLKEFGYNAIRYSHNPAGKNFLDICDEIGMYVMDETFDQWKISQTKYDYAQYFDDEWQKDVTALVSKDYNHPSVIMYCIGNEISDTGLPHGAVISKVLNEAFHQLDNTRPTTIAINGMLSVLAAKQAKKMADLEKEDKVKSKEKSVGSTEFNDIVAMLPQILASITPENLEGLIGECIRDIDIVGYNYGSNLYQKTHEMIPDRVILSSETFPSRIASNWDIVNKNDYVIGDFMWTAWDYLGESGVGKPVYGNTKAPFSKPYPCLTASCGSFDLTGYPEVQAYYTAILWNVYKKPYIGVRPLQHVGEEYTLGNWRLSDALNCWTWPGHEGKNAEIEVYSIGESVELINDGVSLGKKKLESCRANFEAEYKPGKLEAISYNTNGVEISREELITAGEDTKITITSEETYITADGEDLAFISVNVTDDVGSIKMMEDRKITVIVEGEGTLLAVGSGNPETEESFLDGTYTSWHGRVIGIVKSTKKAGKIKVTAFAENLESVSIEIITNRNIK